MNRAEFLEAMKQAQVNEQSFSLDGGSPSEEYVLSDNGFSSWSVYYSERGLQTGLRTFASESDALNHLLSLLLRDPTTRKDRWPRSGAGK